MATISLLSRLVGGVQRQVNLSTNTLWVGDLQLNNSSGYTLAGTTSGHAGSSLIGDDLSYANITQGAAGQTIKGTLQGIDNALGDLSSGTVTSVGFEDESGLFDIDAGPVTSSGTLGITGLVSQAQGYVFAGPSSGGAGTPLFRALVSSDIPSLSSLYLALSGGTMSGAINMGSQQINNLAMASTPASTDAVNVNYVQAVLQGLSPKASVKAATIAALPANTYSNGTAGVGATLTASATGALIIDGYTVLANDRILVKNEVASANNGIYVVTQTGDGSTPYILTRSADADSSTSIPPSVESGIWTFVEATSATLGNSGWILTTPDPITIGTTALDWSQFFAQGEYIFGNGLTASGVNISVNLSASGALGFTSGAIQVLVSASGGVQIASNALSLLLVASTALVTSASGLAWQFDNSTVGVNVSNQAYVKNAGISSTQLATGAFDQLTITGGAGTAASVVRAPLLATGELSGVALSATTLVALRYMVAADSGYTAGSLTQADNNAGSADNFYVLGLAYPAGSVSIGGAVQVVEKGIINVPSHGYTIGTPVYLGSSGAVTNTAPTGTSGIAVVRLGIVKDANNIWVDVQVMGVN